MTYCCVDGVFVHFFRKFLLETDLPDDVLALEDSRLAAEYYYSRRSYQKNGVCYEPKRSTASKCAVIQNAIVYDRWFTKLSTAYQTEFMIMPLSLRVLQKNTFIQCKGLRNVVLNAGLEVIGDCAFMKTGIKRITVPDSVLEIGSYAFQGCSRLKQVTFGKNTRLSKIGLYAFKGTGISSFSSLTDEEKKQRGKNR